MHSSSFDKRMQSAFCQIVPLASYKPLRGRGVSARNGRPDGLFLETAQGLEPCPHVVAANGESRGACRDRCLRGTGGGCLCEGRVELLPPRSPSLNLLFY